MKFQNTYKSIVTPEMALFTFVLLLIVALLIAGFCTPSNFDNTRTKIFISCLAGLGIFITFLFYYSIVTLQQSQQRLNIIEMTNRINKSLKHMIDQIHTASATIPCFTLSLLPLIKHEHIDDDAETIENKLLKTKIAYKIFSLWQEIITAVPFVDIDSLSILSNFLQRAHSKYLYHFWCDMKFDFNLDTQRFGDLLFKHALKITNKHPKSFTDAAYKIHHDPLYYDIMKD